MYLLGGGGEKKALGDSRSTKLNGRVVEWRSWLWHTFCMCDRRTDPHEFDLWRNQYIWLSGSYVEFTRFYHRNGMYHR